MKKLMILIALASVLFASDLSIAMQALERGNFKTAVDHFKIAAEQGNSMAQQNLGVMYNNGFGVAKDTEIASYWFNKANQNNHDAKVALQ